MILRWTILALLLVKFDVLEIAFDGTLLSEPFIRVRLWIVIEDAPVHSVFINSFFVLYSLPFPSVYEELKICDSRLEKVANGDGALQISHDVVWFFCVKNSLIKYSSLFGRLNVGMFIVYYNLLSPVTFLTLLVENHQDITRLQSCYFIYEICLFLHDVIFFAELVEQVRVLE